MFEAYRVGVTLSLTNHVSKGLMLMAGDFTKTEAAASLLQKRIQSIQKDAIKGGLFLGAGVGMLALLKGPYEEAKKLAQAQANFKTLNLSAMENSEAFAKSASMSHKILGTTITENVKGIHDLHTAFGDLHHALRSADDFAKYSFAAKIANGGKDVDGLVYGSVKALEHRGGKVINDDRTFKEELEMQSRVQFGSKGKVSGKDYFAASQTGKMAYTLYDKEYLYGQFAAYMQAKSGATAGTAGMTAFSSLIGGHMDNKGKGFLAELGLLQVGVSKEQVKLVNEAVANMALPDKEKQKLMKAMMPVTGGLKDEFATLFAHRPDKFINDVMAPAIRKRFGMDLPDEQVALIISKHLNRNTSDFLGEHIVNKSKFEKDSEIFGKSMSFSTAYDHFLKSPQGAEEAAHSAWKNFLAVFGSVYLPQITKGLLSLAKSLDSLGQWVEKNKDLVKGLVIGFAALAGVLVIGGSILLLSAAFSGIGIAVTGFGVVLAALSAPIGIAVTAIGTILAACYAFRGLTQDEVDKVKTDGGARLTPGAKARLDAMGDHRPDFIGGKGKSQPVHVETTMQVDGHALGKINSIYQTRQLGKPQSGTSGLDLNLFQLHPSVG